MMKESLKWPIKYEPQTAQSLCDCVICAFSSDKSGAEPGTDLST